MNVYWHDANGKIEKAALNLPEAEAQEEAAAPSPWTALVSSTFVVDINVCYVDAGQVHTMPQQPSPVHTFDYATKAWVDARTLRQIKDDRWEYIKAVRSQHEYGPFTWDGSTFDADSESQRRIQGAAQLAMIAAAASQAFSIDWTLADNTIRTLSGSEMIAVGLALGTHVGTQHVVARTLRDAIESATTKSEVEAVAWPS